MIYLLEDDENIRELVCYSLNVTGNEAEGFAAPSEFWRAVSENLPELVILDVMLPEEDGLQVLSKLRSRDTTSDIPVIMLTAKGSEFDKVTALDAGADDYTDSKHDVYSFSLFPQPPEGHADSRTTSLCGRYVLFSTSCPPPSIPSSIRRLC